MGGTLTAVLAFDEALPLTKPVHADAIDDGGRVLLLEGFIQLGTRRAESMRYHGSRTPRGSGRPRPHST